MKLLRGGVHGTGSMLPLIYFAEEYDAGKACPGMVLDDGMEEEYA